MSQSYFSGKRVLVTGAGGFIGSHLTEALVQAGATVRAMIRYSSRPDAGNLEFLPPDIRDALEIIRGDVRDPYFCRSATEGMDAVFHLAALIGIPYSYVAPVEYVETNVRGTLNILEACRRNDVGRVIHTSTSETYGTAQFRPITEAHPLVGQSPYSASKIGADKIAESYHRSFGTPVVIVRPFNTFGPRQSMRAVIPTILSQLIRGDESLTLGSLTPERDLTFVTDTASGFLHLGACDAAIGRAVNLGVGKAVTIGKLAELCMEITGREVPIVQDPNRVRPAKSEVMALISDNSLAKELSGWEPVVSLREGLTQVAEFVERNRNLFKSKEYSV